MKYIDTDKLKRILQSCINSIKEKDIDAFANGKLSICEELLGCIDYLQPKLTQVPRIEQETKKKGWMDYGLLISEIGSHRSNAIDHIKETKERVTKIERKIAPHDLAILGEYMESVGAEIVLCCLQQYCMDFMFTQDEVKEIVQQEQPEVDLEKLGEIARHLIAVKDHEEDMRLDEGEWLLLERIGYPERFNARKED